VQQQGEIYRKRKC